MWDPNNSESHWIKTKWSRVILKWKMNNEKIALLHHQSASIKTVLYSLNVNFYSHLVSQGSHRSYKQVFGFFLLGRLRRCRRRCLQRRRLLLRPWLQEGFHALQRLGLFNRKCIRIIYIASIQARFTY